jgi:FKBP-type peptidyl-prolyl cis-trans isomerase (trigger factor)
MYLEKELKEVFDFYAAGEADKNNITYIQLAEITDKANLHLSDEEIKKHLSEMGVTGDKIPYKVFIEFFDKKIYLDVPKNDVL